MKLLSDQVDEREVGVVLRELERVLAVNVPGDVTEFGCYVGTTSVHLAERLKGTGRMLWLYDSFEGLPPKTSEDSSPVGEQFVTGELLATKKQLVKNITQAHVPMPKITKGWFSELTEGQVPGQVAFAFLDGDYYLSIKDPLKLIWPRLSPGAIVVVDDYANEALPGAARAVDEWLNGHDAKLHVEHSLAIIQLPN